MDTGLLKMSPLPTTRFHQFPSPLHSFPLQVYITFSFIINTCQPISIYRLLHLLTPDRELRVVTSTPLFLTTNKTRPRHTFKQTCLIYLFLLPIFPPSSYSIVVFFFLVGLSSITRHSQQVLSGVEVKINSNWNLPIDAKTWYLKKIVGYSERLKNFWNNVTISVMIQLFLWDHAQ